MLQLSPTYKRFAEVLARRAAAAEIDLDLDPSHELTECPEGGCGDPDGGLGGLRG